MSGKAPKLRFKAGSFVRDKAGQLYCVRFAFRLKKDPNEWVFYLEERKDTNSPETEISLACAAIAGVPGNVTGTYYEPVWSFDDIRPLNAYWYGSGFIVRNQRMLREFTKVEE